MFCPLCQAEYREGFTECTDCGVALVDERPILPTGDAQAFSARPMAAVWTGLEEEKASRIQDELLRVGLPAEVVGQGSSAFEVRVPPWTVDVVRDILSEAHSSPAPDPPQRATADDAPLLECPLCWNDYPPPVRFCPNCAVALADLEKADPAVKVWEGDHPGDAYQIHQAMLAGNFPFYVTGSEQYISHVLLPRIPLQPHRYSLRVLARDEAEARRTIEALPLVNQTEVEGLPADEPAPSDPFLREEEPEIAWALVWSGTNLEALEALRIAFRENQIQTQVAEADGAHGQRQLLVPVEREGSARAIIRQILEGEVPPELDSPETA